MKIGRPRKYPKLFTSVEIQKFCKPVGDCWIWQHSINGSGYPAAGLVGTAARRILTVKLGRPLTANALHTCDNKLCCNSDHLYEGTQHQNMQDYAQRSARNPSLKLRPDEVQYIRQQVASGSRGTALKLAKRFGVSRATISMLVNKRTWRHLDGGQ
jgi:hypothetical protein